MTHTVHMNHYKHDTHIHTHTLSLVCYNTKSIKWSATAHRNVADTRRGANVTANVTDNVTREEEGTECNHFILLST
jgi:lipopolysaccharide export system protein LptC